MNEISVLYEDDDLIVIDKPPGLVVNKAHSVQGPTVQDWVEKKINIYTDESHVYPMDDFYSRAGIVHRIDKETSGILLIAKNPHAFYSLQKQFKERSVKKTYIALVHGALVGEGIIQAPVGRLPWNRKRFGILSEGKPSVTRYTCIKQFISKSDEKDQKLSLVELSPETGRTHQIRVHMKYINHPVVGDPLYAGRKVSRRDRLWAPRVMLHAWKISFHHPTSGAQLNVVAPIPDDMKEVIN